jgi:hypothetical protein
MPSTRSPAGVYDREIINAEIARVQAALKR